jgi:hypothetical protein
MALKAYGYAWITLILFILSITGHWIFGWVSYADEQTLHGAPPLVGDYVVEMLRDTFENWQSEFLQLLWQVGGLALFLYVGSPQSKESDDRHEAKLDAILQRVDPDGATRTIQEIDRQYLRH